VVRVLICHIRGRGFKPHYFRIVFMKLIKKNPITPGLRHQVNINKNVLSKSLKIVKNLVFNIHKNVGRSSLTGHITVRARGSGVKKSYRNLSFFSLNNLGIVLCTGYNPNSTVFTSLCFDLVTFNFFFLPAVSGVYCGSIVSNALKFIDLKLGFRSCFLTIPVGAFINNVSLSQKSSPQYSLAAGTFCQFLQRKHTNSFIRLPSSQIISIPSTSFGLLGSLSNAYNNSVVLGKAGRNRFMGFRSKVRGIAMNPVDHPHGGRTNGGMPSVSPWSRPSKGQPTVKKKRKYLL
jgi:large subunit ribosomal protein L2